MSCIMCEQTSRYMSADPEMYRGEPRLCSAHRRIRELEQRVRELEWELALTVPVEVEDSEETTEPR